MAALSLAPRTLRTLIAAAVIALAVHFTQSQEALRNVTKPVVVGLLQGIGVPAVDQGQAMVVGKLEVPWTSDCAGINVLLIMLALAVWVNRHEPLGPKFWVRLGCMLPAALAANVLRVLTLIAYRAVAYPAVESPQLHYFMGFLWIVPFVALITPRAGRPLSAALLETLHAGAVIALLAPMAGMPNGTLITIAAVIALSHCQISQDAGALRHWLMLGWVLAGAAISLVNLESFWLPWLLCCPLVLDLAWVKTLPGLLVILSTHALFAMQPWAIPVIAGGAALAFLPGYLKARFPAIASSPGPPVPVLAAVLPTPARRGFGWLGLAGACCFLLPFTASTLLSIGHEKWSPPATMMSRALKSDGFEVKLPGQSSHLALACYAAPGRDRHHTVKVCLKYRGIEVNPTPENPLVGTDGQHWLREYFFQDGSMVVDYASYVARTIRPGADPGVHLIFIAPMDQVGAVAFDRECAVLAGQFHTLSQPAPPLSAGYLAQAP